MEIRRPETWVQGWVGSDVQTAQSKILPHSPAALGGVRQPWGWALLAWTSQLEKLQHSMSPRMFIPGLVWVTHDCNPSYLGG
jgi:hypothetical protein